MKKYTLIILLILSATALSAQITLAECQEKALENYPVLRQSSLIEKAEGYSLSAASASYLPHLSISGKATYQSEVTEISLPMVSMDPISRDQYQIMVELKQTLWDGGITSSRKDIIEAASKLERGVLDSELYALRERVNQIYFGILLLEERLSQNLLLQDELKTNYNRILSLRNYGLATESDLNVIRVEQLNALQAETDLNYGIASYRGMLSQITGIPLPDSVKIIRPESDGLAIADEALNRPEVSMYKARIDLLEAQKSLLKARKMPQLNAFVQGGYGRPGFNMMDDSFRSFYIAGLQFYWSLDAFYTSRSDLESLETDKQLVQTEIDRFLYNTGLQIVSQKSEIERLKLLIRKDDEIIDLRKGIKEDAEIKLDNGTITINDLIREITAENLARQTKSLHEIQLLQSLYQLNFTTNK